MRSNLDSLIGDDGNLKQSATLTPREFFDAAKRGLKSASGKSLKLVEPTPNPLSAKILREQAPQELQDALEQATTRLKESQHISNKLFDQWINAQREKRHLSADYGEDLTDHGKTKLSALYRGIQQRENDLKDDEDCATLARVEKMNAVRGLGEWIRDRRSEIEAGEAEALKKTPLRIAASARGYDDLRR